VLRRLLLPLLASLLTLLLSACPPPVTNEIATAVSDKMAPSITVTSPTALTYQGSMHFAGTITDDASSTGDGKGSVRSIEYTVANDNTGQRQSRLLIDSNGAASVDTSFGSGSVIAWTRATHSYAFDVSTVVPFVMPGILQVTIIATDENGNAQKQVISLFSGGGPSITITAPTASFQYALGGGTVLNLGGTVVDAAGLTTATNIKTLKWEVVNKLWGATISVPSGILSVANPLFSLANFTFAPASGSFSAQIQIPSVTDATLTVRVTATDFNGTVVSQEVNINAIGANAPQVLIQNPPPSPAVSYYSSANYAPITVSGIIASSDIPNLLTLTFKTTAGGISSSSLRLFPTDDTGTFTLIGATGAFSFVVTAPPPSSGPAQITLTATGTNLLVSNPSVTIQDDPTAPTLTATLSSNNTTNSLYAKANDVVRLIYTATDTGSGISGTPGLTIMGSPVVPPTLVSGTYTYDYTVQNTDSGTFQFLITTSDAAGNTASRSVISSGSNVTLYGGTLPLSSVSIRSSAPAPSAPWAKTGDKIQVSFTSTRDFSSVAPVVTIAGHATTLSPAFSPTVHSYTATTTTAMTGAEAEGPVSFSIAYTDAAGNADTVTSTTDSSSVTFDKTPPVISNAQFASTPWMKIGTPAVTLTFDATDNLASAPLAAGTILVNGKDVTGSFTPVSGSTYSVTYAATDTLHDVAQGSMPISIVMKDAAGNTSNTVTTVTGGTPGVDTTVPTTPSSVTFNPSNAWLTTTTGVTITFTSTDTSGSGVNATQPATTISVNNQDVSGSFTPAGGNTYSVTYTPAGADTNRAKGAIPISIKVTDAAGNTSGAYTTSPVNLGVDTNGPVVSAVSFANNNWMKQGASVVLNFTAIDTFTAAPLPTPTANSITVNGTDVSSTFVRVSGNNYKVTYTVPDTLHDVAQNAMTFSIVVQDAAGNSSTPVTQASPAFSGGTPGVDTVAPVITGLSFNPSSGWLKAGTNNLTLTITLQAGEVGLTAALAADIQINNKNVGASLSYTSGALTATVPYSVVSPDTAAQNAISVTATVTDAAGNPSNTVTTAPGGTPGLDTTVPTTPSSVTFNPSNAWLTTTTGVTITFTSTDTSGSGVNATQPATTISVNNQDVSGSFTPAGGNTYSVTYTPAGADTNRAKGAIPISIKVTDAAGNSSGAYTTSPPNLGVDTNGPAVSAVSFANSNWMKQGSSVVLNFTAIDTFTSAPLPTPSAGSIIVNNTDVSSTFVRVGTSGNNYKVTYTVPDTLHDVAQNAMTFSIAVQDAAGNSSTPVTTVSSGGTPGVDTVAPVITGLSFNPSSGWLKAGTNNLTLTIALQAGEVGLAAAAADIQINNKNVGASLSYTSGNLTATVPYSVVSPDTAAQNAIQVSATVTDAAGNPSNTVTTAPGGTPGLDTTAPTIDVASSTVLNTGSSSATVAFSEPVYGPSSGPISAASLQFRDTNTPETTTPVSTDATAGTMSATFTLSWTTQPTASPADTIRVIVPTSPPAANTIYDAAGNVMASATISDSSFKARTLSLFGAVQQGVGTAARRVSTVLSEVGSLVGFKPTPAASVPVNTVTAAAAAGPDSGHTAQASREQFYQPIQGTAAVGSPKASAPSLPDRPAAASAVVAAAPALATASPTAARGPTSPASPPASELRRDTVVQAAQQPASPESPVLPGWMVIVLALLATGLIGGGAWGALRFLKDRKLP
jgi:hypothetical protein